MFNQLGLNAVLIFSTTLTVEQEVFRIMNCNKRYFFNALIPNVLKVGKN